MFQFNKPAAPASNPTPSFSFTTPTPAASQSNSIFGNSTANQQQQQPQPSSSIFGNTQPSSNTNLSSSTFLNTQSTNTVPPSQAAIDLNHLRPTTKFDHLTKDLQTEIENLDTAIQNEINKCNEIPDALLKLEEQGITLAPGIDFVSSKLDEVEVGLENDATDIVHVRDTEQRRNEGEAKCAFRAVDRLKVPRQYQVGHKQNESISGGVYGGSGLSGWWNNPQTLKGTLRGSRGDGKGNTMQLPGEETEDNVGPKSLVELFDRRSEGMGDLMKGNRVLLEEIEDFVGGLEEKVRGKERLVNERLNYGGQGKEEILSEREHQLKLLRYVFGEVERSMFEVAGKVGGARDDVMELGNPLGRR